MWWFLFCLVGLVASKPYPGNIQKRGLSCFFTRPPPPELPSININPTDIINTPGNFFDEHYIPTTQEVPLVNWAGSGPGHTLQYRAWRFHSNNTAPDNFHVQVEFQITAPLNALITFGASSARQPGDPGFGMQTQGLAEVASTSRFPRRWSLELMIPRRHLNVQYWISGSWRNA